MWCEGRGFVSQRNYFIFVKPDTHQTAAWWNGLILMAFSKTGFSQMTYISYGDTGTAGEITDSMK